MPGPESAKMLTNHFQAHRIECRFDGWVWQEGSEPQTGSEEGWKTVLQAYARPAQSEG